MANNYYSLRSYNHFCFFSQINNSKKKKDELAFFIFFAFKGWKRLLVADGPRQVINALTLYALAEISDFSTNISDYYEGNIFTAVMLLTMLFTVIVFAGSFILLAIATLMYLPLICYIKGNLKEYCCHKIDKRISELVQKKKKQRLGKYAAIARAEAAGDFSHLMNKKGVIVGRKMMQPTLPQLDVDLMADDTKAIKNNMSRNESISSSTVNGGYYGTEKGIHGLKEGEEYGSSAQLMLNQGQAGSVAGHLYGNNNGSFSSATINVNPSIPPTALNSPDAYPMQIRGMQSTQEVLRSQGSFSNSEALAQMGPIGTTPDMFAKRVLGRNGTVASSGSEGARELNGARSPALSAHRVGGAAGRSPLGAKEASEAYQENGYYGQQQQSLGNAMSYTASNNGEDYDPSNQGNGLDRAEYPHAPPMAMHEPTDLSAYAPYHQDGGENYLSANSGGGSQQLSRVHSFSEVYEAYYEEHDGHSPSQEVLGAGDYQQQQQQQYDDQGYNTPHQYALQGPQGGYQTSSQDLQQRNGVNQTADGTHNYSYHYPTSHQYRASQTGYPGGEQGQEDYNGGNYAAHAPQRYSQYQQTTSPQYEDYSGRLNTQMYNNYQAR
jgi:hypothetical protein